ncbi:MAG: BatD family protein [Prevotellaceae bacterium]|nr:BatD family protein [Prevotellaceae bacterium]
MRNKLFIIWLILLAVGIGENVYAQTEPSFVAEAPSKVAVGDQFRVAYTVSTDKVKDFRAPARFTGFDVLSGPNRSTRSSTEIVNGKMTSTASITYTYILMANTEGTFSIPASTIVADGKTLISNAVNVEVLPKDQSANASGGTSSRGGTTSSGATAITDQDIFIRATASRTKVYEQEALLLTYKIYTAVDLRTFDNVKLPDFKGFLSQEMDGGQTVRFQLEHYNGRNYNAGVYRQFVLFPQQSGKLTIEPARFDAVIAQAQRNIDPFDAFFNGGLRAMEVKKTLTTPAMTINVEPLPANRPAGFVGGVGSFTLKSTISTDKIKENEAVTLTVRIAGQGNMRLIANPKIEFPADFETYDPKITNNVTLNSEGNKGEKVIEYLAIARHAGTYTIPSASFTYFDPKAGAYKTLKTEPYTITVERGSGSGEGGSTIVSGYTNKEDLRVLGQDIRFIKRGAVTLHPYGSFLYGSFVYWLWYLIPLIAFGVFVVIHRKQTMANANVTQMRTRKANKIATKRLKQAGTLLKENKKEAFYDEVLKALWGYISDKLSIPVSQLSKDNVAEKLAQRNIQSELIDAFLSALNECEFARFAPGDESQAMDKVYTVALDAISRIENSMKR